MNIYIVPAWYPENDKDLNASFIREQAHALFSRGHNTTIIVVKIFSLRELTKFFKYKERIWNDNGIVTKFYKRLILTPSRFKQRYHKRVSLKYFKIFSDSISYDLRHGKEKPNIIHSHVGPWCSYFCIPAAKKLGLPIITTEHYSGLTNGDKSDLKFIREKYVVENSDLTIFVGTHLRDIVLETTGAKGNTVVIPNQIDVNAFKNIKLAKKDNFTFLTACHLVPLKRIELIIQAFHEEFNGEKRVSYLIAGNGPMRNNLEKLVLSLHEEEKIKFFGKYSREEMPNLFSGCDAFVLTSEFETFGIVYIEAMMCGLPCIGTKGQGSDDIINQMNGISVDFGNIPQLRKAMRYIFENREIFDSKLITNETIANFSSDNVCAKIEAEYKKILSKY